MTKYTHYDRLSALDSMFLEFEESRVHMHVGAVALFEAAALMDEDEELAFDRVLACIEAALTESPRFRQRLARIPVFEHPVWVDDECFNLRYHVRHTSLPKPGDLRMLKRLVGRIMSQKIDLSKPLWEMWVIEGIEQDRIAVIFKAHHSMVDGVAGIDLLARVLSPDPEAAPEPVEAWYPRDAPSGSTLFRNELLHRASWPLGVARRALGALRAPSESLSNARDALLGIGEVLTQGLTPTSDTPLNEEIGPHRRFDWARIEMSAIKEVRNRLGGTLNDVVLATTAGVVGRFLQRRGVSPEGRVFRAQIPVNIRREFERAQEGNRVVMLLAELPIDEPDPVRRLERVIETTRNLKASHQRAGVEAIEDLSDALWSSIFVRFAQLATRQRSFNLVVTNVPGPPVPVYLLGAKMLEIYPLVPLATNQCLGIALFSYAGQLYWGFNSDWDNLPDLHDMVNGVTEEFESLHKAAMRS